MLPRATAEDSCGWSGWRRRLRSPGSRHRRLGRPNPTICASGGWSPGRDLATLMFAKPELARHAGKSYIPELMHFEGTSTAMQALATGELDCAALAYSTFALGVVNAGMQDLRVIPDGFPDGVPRSHTTA